MNFGLSDEQQMLREAARDALSRLATVAAAREALDGAELLDLWPTAREAGWTGLLVGEEHGGAGLLPFDAMLVLEECGRNLTGAKLFGHLLATHVLQQGGMCAAGPLLAALATGERSAAFAPARPPTADEGWTVDGAGGLRCPAPRVSMIGGRPTLNGSVSFVPDLAGANLLVVAAIGEDDEPLAVALENPSRGVAVERTVRFDGTRPLGHLTLTGASGELVARGPASLEAGWYLAQALLAADALGGCQTLLDMGVEYAKERHTFGRPIGSYQAVKHQLVEILRWIDTIRNLCFYAGFAAEARPEELAVAASCARFAGEQGFDYATRTCIAVHGGIGATWEHDAPFFWRRAQLSRRLLGGLADAGDRVASEIIATAQAGTRQPVAA